MRRPSTWIGCCLLVMPGVACSPAPDPRTAGQVATPAVGSPPSPSVGETSRGPATPGRTRRAGPGGSDGAEPTQDDAQGPSGRPPGRTASRGGSQTQTASRTDPSGDPDRGGDPPAYTDIRRATLRGTGKSLRLVLRVDGGIPSSLPDGTDMTMNFRLEMRGNDRHQLYAVGGRDGWRADLDNSGSFPGRFRIAGDSFVFQLAWSRLGGVKRFRWEAETAWTRTPSGPLAQTEFAFDRVPEYEAARYPE